MSVERIACELKALDPADGNGEFEVILSDESLDRHGEVVQTKAFNPLPERIPIDIDHGLSVTTTVGSAVPYYEGNTLKARGTFASTTLAQEVRTLVTEGHIQGVSVAFANGKRENLKGIRTVTSADLINATFAPVAVNRGARVISAKSLSDDDLSLALKAIPVVINRYVTDYNDGGSSSTSICVNLSATDVQDIIESLSALIESGLFGDPATDEDAVDQVLDDAAAMDAEGALDGKAVTGNTAGSIAGETNDPERAARIMELLS